MGERRLIDHFQGKIRGRLLPEEPLSNYTSFRVGGIADLLFFPADGDDLRVGLSLAARHSVPVSVLGNGTNVLVRDGGVRGLTVHVGSLEGISTDAAPGGELAEGQTVDLSAMAGTQLSRAINFSIGEGLSGLEFAAGIPGTVGGAVIMNAGAHGWSFGNIVTWLEMTGYGGEQHKLERSQMEFFYRGSRFPHRGIITRVGFRLTFRGEEYVQQGVKSCLSERERRLPFGFGMAGSVFKNPEGGYAGKIIESLGLKGMRIGRAEVSRKHANVIVNLGGATASEILALVGEITDRVLRDTGIRLEPEIKVIGEQ